MTPFTFQAFWVFAGIAAGLFIGVPSRAAIAGHPLHPMLIPFPIAFFVGAFLTDLAYWSTGDPFWARASFWLVAAGLVGGALAAVLGLIDFLSIPRVREHPAG